MQKKNKMKQNTYNGSKIIGLGLHILVAFFFFFFFKLNDHQHLPIYLDFRCNKWRSPHFKEVGFIKHFFGWWLGFPFLPCFCYYTIHVRSIHLNPKHPVREFFFFWENQHTLEDWFNKTVSLITLSYVRRVLW